MDGHRKDSNNTLEAALNVVRNSEPDRLEMETGAARVWAHIGHELDAAQSERKSGAFNFSDQIRSCEDYRALIPDYLAGRLSPARAILFKDHTHECVSCRNALNAATSSKPQLVLRPPKRRLNRTAAVFAVAAGLIIAVVLERSGYLNFLFPVVEVQAMARTIDGQLYRIDGLTTNPVAAGDAMKAGVPVRTGAGSRAVVELRDGTRIEMRERSQLSLVGARDGVRVNLERGSVIVEAAKQRDGHLYVATDDCSVSVVGTVFAVSTGVKGSRVSVLEGEVRVSEAASPEKALLPGQQITTTSSLGAVSIEDEISWSQNLNTHLALLRALADVNNFLRDRVPGPQLRFNSMLLPLVPPNTVVYGAFPNLSSTLGQAYDLFRQRIDQDPLLRTWWSTQNTRRDATSLTLEEMIAHVRSLGGQLGQEVVIAVTGSSAGPGDVIALANVQNASGAVAEVRAILASGAGQNPVRVLTDPTQLAQLSTTDRGPIAYVGGSILVLASSPKAIYDVVSAQQSGRSSFTGPFYTSIAQAYSQGAGTLFAADLATLFSQAQRSQEARVMGLSSIDGLVVEQKQVSGKTMTRAQLSFTGERTGVGAWLASPAPMGALEFVSPQAYGVASIVTKDAVKILDDILTLGVPGGQSEIDQFQRLSGVDVRRDLAEPLGGEFLFAMDGPFLPMPSWKFIAEVYDSARLQNTIERLVRQVASLAGAGTPALSLSSEASGGQIYYRLRRSDGQGTEMNYTYALGYMIAAPSRGLLTQALQYQQSRSSIAGSAKFRSMMPADGQDHCSAILYQNLTETAASIANYVPSGVGGLTSQQLQTLRQTVDLTPATLVCAAGEPNRIVMGYQGDLAFNVLMLGGLQRVMSTVGAVR